MWFFLALAFALITSIGLVFAKIVLKEASIFLYLFWTEAIASLVLFILVALFYQVPKTDNVFLTNISIAAGLDIVAAILAAKAIKLREVSLLAPVSAFNPVFTAVISYFTLGETISHRGIVGILVVCLGAYLLQISEVGKGILKPIKSLMTDKGVLLILISYLIWAVTPTLQKNAILHTNPNVPPFASLIEGLMILPIYFIMATILAKDKIRLTKKLAPWLILIGLLAGIGSAAGFIAFNLTTLGIATAVFKLSMVFSVIMGWLLFKEHHFRERILGTTVMLLGVILLVK